jgi:hypothetical protein
MAGTLRDQLLPVADTLRNLPQIFGIRRFAVTVRRRVWTGNQAGIGTATNHDIMLTPPPRVRDITSRDLTATEVEYKAINSGVIVGNMYRVDKITPRYTTASGSGGYLAEQLRLWPNRDTGAVENLVALVGDDGYLRECVQVTFEQDRAFGYTMIAKEIDRPRSSLQSVAIQPPLPSIDLTLFLRYRGVPRAGSNIGKTLQLTAVGTFAGGATSLLTTLTAWSTGDPSVVTVDIYGLLTATGVGSTTVTAAVLGVSVTVPVTVT